MFKKKKKQKIKNTQMNDSQRSNDSQQSNNSQSSNSKTLPDYLRKRLERIPPHAVSAVIKRWEDWNLFQQRKQLFNSYSKPRVGGGGPDTTFHKLIWKPPADQPNLLSPHIKEIIAQYRQDSLERLEELKNKNKK